MKQFNAVSTIAGFLFGAVNFLWGNITIAFKVLIALVIIDFITGTFKAIYYKQVSSDIGFKGIIKKALIFIVIAVTYLLQSVISIDTPLRDIVIMFYIVNEGISILENISTIDKIPIPKKLNDILLQLRGEEDYEQSDDT